MVTEQNKIVYGVYTFLEMSFKTVNDNMIFQFKVNYKMAKPSLCQKLGGNRILKATVEEFQNKIKYDPRVRNEINAEEFVRFAFQVIDDFDVVKFSDDEWNAIRQDLFFALANLDVDRKLINEVVSNF